MNKWVISIVAIIAVYLVAEVSIAKTKQVGASSQCDTVLAGCRPVPVVSTICLNPSTCARVTASDPTNSNTFYGTDGTNCRKSTNGGTTWANCGANPSTVLLFHYAVNEDGEVLAAGNGPGGASFIIQRSTNGGTSWSNVFSSATVDADNATIFTQRIACSRTTLICIALYRSPASQFIALHSIDGGATWTSTTLGQSFGTIVGVAISGDGGLGGAGIRLGDGVSNYKGAIWNGSSWSLSAIWPNTASALCTNTLIWNADVAVFCKETTASTHTIRDYQGQIQSTITVPNGFTGVPTSYTGYMVGINEGSTAPVVIMGADSRPGTSVWISIDGTTFFQTNLLTDSGSGVAFQGSAYLANGCAYFSSNQALNPTGIFLKAC